MTPPNSRLLRTQLALLALFLSFLPSTARVQASEKSQQSKRLLHAVKVLKTTPSGEKILRAAASLWKISNEFDWLTHLHWGESSRTDAVLTRHYNPKTGDEIREREVSVYLKEDQDFDSVVLDLAHELTHAVSKPSWDPYDPALTAEKYISSSIEGPGGEVEAVYVECQVGFESATLKKEGLERCKSYLNAKGLVSKKEIVNDFYRVGSYRTELILKLSHGAPNSLPLSEQRPKLFSSTGNAPYPVALLREYEEITEIACENSKKRYGLLTQGRAPASIGGADLSSLGKFLSTRCKVVLSKR